MNFKIRLVLLLTGTFLLPCQRAFSDEKFPFRSLLPDYGQVQFAGDVGFLSIGLGYIYYHDHLETKLSYGFTPEAFAQVNIHTVHLKGVWSPFIKSLGNKYFIKPVTVAVSCNTTWGESYDVILPRRFRSYYFPSGITNSLYGGTRIGVHTPNGFFFRKVEFYTELTILFQNVTNYYRNEFVTFREVCSLDLGIIAGW